MLDAKSALKLLQEYNITNSLQMVCRWARTGKLKATIKSKRVGWEIDEESLYQFIDERKPDYRWIEKQVKVVVQDKETLQERYDELLEKYKKVEKENRKLKKQLENLLHGKEILDEQGERITQEIDIHFYEHAKVKEMNEIEKEKKKKELLDHFFEKGKLKSNIYDPVTEKYYTPSNSNVYKYLKAMVKRAVEEFLGDQQMSLF